MQPFGRNSHLEMPSLTLSAHWFHTCLLIGSPGPGSSSIQWPRSTLLRKLNHPDRCGQRPPQGKSRFSFGASLPLVPVPAAPISARSDLIQGTGAPRDRCTSRSCRQVERRGASLPGKSSTWMPPLLASAARRRMASHSPRGTNATTRSGRAKELAEYLPGDTNAQRQLLLPEKVVDVDHTKSRA